MLQSHKGGQDILLVGLYSSLSGSSSSIFMKPSSVWPARKQGGDAFEIDILSIACRRGKLQAFVPTEVD